MIRFFQKDHWFYTKNILRLEGAGESEPFLSGQLRVSEEFLSRVLLDKEYKPDYNIGFPAKRITTQLEWEDMILDYQVATELEEINVWISSGKTVMEDWGLSRILKAGYRSLFYGPPGTGKTLAATLLGKKNEMDVYRIDLSMIVSKYIGETEKNLAKVFDLAENRNWILFLMKRMLCLASVHPPIHPMTGMLTRKWLTCCNGLRIFPAWLFWLQIYARI